MADNRYDLVADPALVDAYGHSIANARSNTAVVSADELLQVVERRGSESERVDILNRVAQNAESVRELNLLRSAQALRPKTQRNWSRAITGIAAILAVIVANKLIGPKPDMLRSGNQNAVTLISPTNGANGAHPAEFVWHSFGSNIGYQLHVLDDAGAVVWQVSTFDTTAVVSDSTALSRAASWYIAAATATGEVRSPSWQIKSVSVRKP